MFQGRNLFPRWLIFTIDLLIVIGSFWIAHLLRFNFKIPALEMEVVPYGITTLVLVRVVGFLYFKTYAGMIAYTSTEDAQRIFTTTAIGTLLIGIANLALHYTTDAKYLIPFSILLIDFLAEMVLLMGYRIGVKILYLELQQSAKEKISVLIYGASEAGIITKKVLERDRKKNYQIVGFVDSSSKLAGQKLEGINIYHINTDFENLLVNQEIQQVIIAVWEIPASLKKFIVDTCLKFHVKVLHVPSSSEWLNGDLNYSQIKEVKIEELLERDPIKLDQRIVRSHVNDKTVLVTGAAGSIGSEIVRQLAQFKPSKLVLLDQAESPLYELDFELKKDFAALNYEIIIADVRVKERMEHVFRSFTPDLVYHAAAYKHVPLMEDNPTEAVNANVLGTKICADLAVEYGTEKFVLVSTDKAVNPTNIMGASKRIAEMYVQSLDQDLHASGKLHTRFITTRFGNVLGSNGSVIPLFRKQIENGGPVTVTHPEVTRFFMTIPEACQLVMEAGAMGSGGEIYVFDMGEPILIAELAKKMIALSGLEPGRDIQIIYTGLRPGEKLYEELLTNEENTIATHHPKIMIARVRLCPYKQLATEINDLIELFSSQDNIMLVGKMKEIVPEFVSNNSIYEELDKIKETVN